MWKITLCLLAGITIMFSGCALKELKPEGVNNQKQEQNQKQTGSSGQFLNNKNLLNLVGVDNNGWKIYRNEVYEFKIDDALNYEIKEDKNNTVYILFNNISENIVDYPNQIDFHVIEGTISEQKKRLEKIFLMDKIFKDKILINGLQGEEYEYNDEQSNFHDLILLSNSEARQVYWLSLKSKNKSEETINTFKNIINTFKCIK